MNDDLLTRLRPVDASAGAIRAALDAVRTEREAAAARIRELDGKRAASLLTATAADLRAMEEAARDAELDMPRLDAMADALTTELKTSIEADRAREAERRVAAARDAILKFNGWMGKSYLKHARALAEGIELERAALAATEAAKTRSPEVPSGTVPSELPAIMRAYVGREGRSLSAYLRLPGAAPGEPLFWKVDRS